MPENAAEVGRIADRAADVRADFQAGHTARQRCRGAAGRAAGAALRVPRIVGGAVNIVIALEVSQPQGYVRLSENHGPGGLQPLDRQRIFSGDIVLQLRRAERRRQPGDVERLLARHRHAVQRSPDLTTRQSRVRLPGTLTGAIGIQHDNGVKLRVEPAHPFQVVVQKLQAADLPVPNRLRQRNRWLERHVHHVPSMFDACRPETAYSRIAAPSTAAVCSWMRRYSTRTSSSVKLRSSA